MLLLHGLFQPAVRNKCNECYNCCSVLAGCSPEPACGSLQAASVFVRRVVADQQTMLKTALLFLPRHSTGSSGTGPQLRQHCNAVATVLSLLGHAGMHQALRQQQQQPAGDTAAAAHEASLLHEAAAAAVGLEGNAAHEAGLHRNAAEAAATACIDWLAVPGTGQGNRFPCTSDCCPNDCCWSCFVPLPGCDSCTADISDLSDVHDTSI